MNLEIELENEIRRQLQEGIKLARNGDKAEAAEIFSRILSANPDHEDGLVWLAAVTEDRAEAVRCLKRALALNPNNRRAQAGLEWAERRLEAGGESAEAPPPPTPRTIASTPDSAAPGQIIPFQHPRASLRQPKGSDSEITSAPQPAINPKLETRNSKLETINQPPPYKKSRLPNLASKFVLPPEALPQKPSRSGEEKPSKKRFGRRQASRSGESSVIDATLPKIAVTVSDRVRLGVQGYRQPGTINITWPLLLFMVALALALLTFLLSAFAPLLGVLALLVAMSGIILFDRAEF